MEKMKMGKQLSFVNREYSSKEEALKVVCSAAEEMGYVTGDFVKDLIKREEEFPTGLATKVPLAMPHVGSNCNVSFMSLTTLKKPIAFRYMDGTEGTVLVELIFVFGIVNPKDQVMVLRKLSEIFQNKEALEEIRSSKNDNDGCEIIRNMLGDLIEIV